MTEKERDLKKAMYLELMPQYNNNIGKVCKKIGITRNTIGNWREKDEKFDEDCIELHEVDIDESEERHKMLRKGILKLNDKGEAIGWEVKPDRRALTEFLFSHAKHRGWKKESKLTIEPSEYEKLTKDEAIALANKRIEQLQKIANNSDDDFDFDPNDND